MNFEDLLRPYKEGGTVNKQVERTMGTMVDYLVNKKGYPLDIVGGAMFLVFNWLNNGNRFKGDGTYGSKGRELVTAVRLKCDDLMRERLTALTYKAFVETYADNLFNLVEDRIADKVPNYRWIELKRKRFINWWHGRKVYDVST